MNIRPDELINACFDGTLSDEGREALNAWIKADPENALAFARAALLHDRLRDRFAEVDLDAYATTGRPPTKSLPGRRSALVAAASILLLAALALVPALSARRAGAAEAVLDRLIEAAGRPGDRTYRIVALDPDPLPSPPGRPPIDGALLHVRGKDEYVLIRRPGTDLAFVTGSDGREAWSIPPDGPVRVSPDPTRFRGAVPGEQQGLPFLDLPTALVRLREAYRLELDPGRPGTLRALKKSGGFRGPREVEIESDPATGEVRRLRLDGLPQAQGGPRSLALERVNSEPLGRRFFEHEAHHDEGRRVVREGGD